MPKQTSLLTEGHFFGQNNIEIEELVLGAFVNFPNSYYQVADQLSIEEFSSQETRYIYSAIKEVATYSKIDIATVTDKLIQKKYDSIMSNKLGFNLLSYLNTICEQTETDEHLTEHVKLLNGYAQRRALLILGKNIIEQCNDMIDPSEIIEEGTKTFINVQEMGEVEDFNKSTKIDEIITTIKNREIPPILKSGIKTLDKFMYGWEYGEMVVVAGAPSMGKTALALEIFKNAIHFNYNPVMFSLEMSDQSLLKRMFAAESQIDVSKMRSMSLTDEEITRLSETGEKFKQYNFWIDYKSRKISKICNQIRKYVIRHKTKLVVLDYLQLADCDIVKTNNREQQIAVMSRQLKEVAAELNIVIIPLSQINRGVNSRENKRPMLSDLRESGAIEQDADMVCFVYRPAYYNIQGEKPSIENAELIIAKGRNTGVGKVEIQYVPRFTKYLSDEPRTFENYTENSQDNWNGQENNQSDNKELFRVSPFTGS
jgi:replicative DNA helicase